MQGGKGKRAPHNARVTAVPGCQPLTNTNAPSSPFSAFLLSYNKNENNITAKPGERKAATAD